MARAASKLAATGKKNTVGVIASLAVQRAKRLVRLSGLALSGTLAAILSSWL